MITGQHVHACTIHLKDTLYTCQVLKIRGPASKDQAKSEAQKLPRGEFGGDELQQQATGTPQVLNTGI